MRRSRSSRHCLTLKSSPSLSKRWLGRQPLPPASPCRAKLWIVHWIHVISENPDYWRYYSTQSKAETGHHRYHDSLKFGIQENKNWTSIKEIWPNTAETLTLCRQPKLFRNNALRKIRSQEESCYFYWHIFLVKAPPIGAGRTREQPGAKSAEW